MISNVIFRTDVGIREFLLADLDQFGRSGDKPGKIIFLHFSVMKTNTRLTM